MRRNACYPRYLAVACLLWLATATTSSLAATSKVQSAVPYQLRDVTFKENGRLDPELMDLCNAKQSMQNAVRDRRLAKNAPPAKANDVMVDIQIDKIARLGAGNHGLRWGGLDFAVTATVVSSADTQTQFFCRGPVLGAIGRYSYCSAIGTCSNEVVENIGVWLDALRRTRPLE